VRKKNPWPLALGNKKEKVVFWGSLAVTGRNPKNWPIFFFFFSKNQFFALGAKIKHLISEPLQGWRKGTAIPGSGGSSLLLYALRVLERAASTKAGVALQHFR